MTYIFENLYSGDVDDAFKCSRKGSCGYILTLDSKPLPLEIQENVHYLYVHCLDSEQFNLLKHLNECLKFIDEGRKSGSSVLVHCNAGISRSGAVVIAFLMKHMCLDYDDALLYAKKMKSTISPNTGFIDQLKLFEQMGNIVNENNFLYRQYCLKLFAEDVKITQNFLNFNDLFYAPDPKSNPTNECTYNCKACRRILFRQSSVIQHHMMENFNFNNKKQQTKKLEFDKKTTCNICTQSLFIEPVLWMKKFILCMSGKILCPKCESKLGSFSWTGAQCSCGKWITPAFHILNSKVEAVKLIFS